MNGHWSQMKESGSTLGMLIIFYCLKFFGRVVAKPILYIVVSYYFVVRKDARNASLRYLKNLNAAAAASCTSIPAPSLGVSYRHFISFADAIVDRIDCWLGRIKRSAVNFPERHDVEAMFESAGKGCVILTSHLGNMDMCRAFFGELGSIKLNVLVDLTNATTINRVMQHINPGTTFRLIDISTINPATAVKLNDLIESGEAIVIAADRTSARSMNSTSVVTFLGQPAPFPNGPYILASLFDCPVFTMFCMKENGRYSIFFEPFADRIHLPRKSRAAALETWAGQYAARLSAFCMRFPGQWYNFYNFWETRSG